MAEYSFLLETVEVRAVRRVSPSFVRVELGADGLADLGLDGPWLDTRVKIVFPGASGVVPTFETGDDWYARWLALPDEERGCMRTYTVRDVVGEGVDTRMVIDIVVHDPGEHGDATGPGNDWARNATIGDQVALMAPRRGHAYGGIEWLPGPGARDLLIVGDETAAPAVYGVLRDLPRDARGTAYLEVPCSDDVLDDVVGPEGVEVVWLPRDGRPRGEELRARVLERLDATATAHADAGDLEEDPDEMPWETPVYSASGEEVGGEAPADGPFAGLYAWIAGESRVVTGLRRALVKDLGVDRQQVAFMGYWREGVAMKA
ncbi:siderophore-interacting protein [Nocardioides zeae]|uniref:Siderophore-interacting protein n=1 Tax=Nocardioides imazamoxiresistens TaxID=3231893 RepID=A0ABU3PX59_9ACTN|nr:siderophore-interacting protein [Nocardioides zeae]MDT9593355.1 siderophore-interacting protein [Nocardioides zeae]